MAKTRQQKEMTLADLTTRMSGAKSMVFANLQKLKMKEMDELRKVCRDGAVGVLVSKKTLMQKALKDRGLTAPVDAFEGGVAAFFGMQDEVAPAQIVANFAKTHEVVNIFGGVLEGIFIDSAKVKALSKLPSKQQLLGQLVGTLQAPVAGFVNVLAGNLRGLVNVLNGIKEKKA